MQGNPIFQSLGGSYVYFFTVASLDYADFIFRIAAYIFLFLINKVLRFANLKDFASMVI